MATGWIKLDSARLNQPQTETFRGAQVEVRMSPYELPEAVRAYTNPDRTCFTIEFRYLGTDEPVRETPVGAVTPYTGRESGRLLRLDIDLSRLPGGAHGLTLKMVHQAIDSLGKGPDRLARRRHYEVVEQTLEENPELLEAAVS